MVGTEAEVDLALDPLVQVAVAGEDGAALADREGLGGVKGDDLDVALGADRHAVGSDGAEGRGRVDRSAAPRPSGRPPPSARGRSAGGGVPKAETAIATADRRPAQAPPPAGPGRGASARARSRAGAVAGPPRAPPGRGDEGEGGHRRDPLRPVPEQAGECRHQPQRAVRDRGAVGADPFPEPLGKESRAGSTVAEPARLAGEVEVAVDRLRSAGSCGRWKRITTRLPAARSPSPRASGRRRGAHPSVHVPGSTPLRRGLACAPGRRPVPSGCWRKAPASAGSSM